MNETTQQEKTTQLSSSNEHLNSAAGTKQLNSPVGTKQLNSALPPTAYNRLHRLYSRIGFFYLLSTILCPVEFHFLSQTHGIIFQQDNSWLPSAFLTTIYLRASPIFSWLARFP
ncbi:hypothetical protein TNCV_3597451 [Trichonephila clavipes]|nr:hypothetical protein TNCV_3597451 [Trichonephila clavipes]